MTSPTEQMFLFGDVIDTAPPSGLELLGYADLTAGSAIILATIIISTLLLSFWKDLTYCMSTIVKTVVDSVATILLGAWWLIQKIAAIRTFYDLIGLLYMINDGIKKLMMNSPPGQLLSAIIAWYFPFNSPLATLCRLALSFVCGNIAYSSLLVPVYWYVQGFGDALHSSEKDLSWECLILYKVIQYGGPLSSSQRLDSFYCYGQDAGFGLNSMIQEELRLPRRSGGEIQHASIFASVILCVACAILALLSYGTLSTTTLSDITRKVQLTIYHTLRGPSEADSVVDNTKCLTTSPTKRTYQVTPLKSNQGSRTHIVTAESPSRGISLMPRPDYKSPRGRPLTQAEIDLWNMNNSCEILIAKQKTMIRTKNQEIEQLNQRLEGAWARVNQLSSPSLLTEESPCRESALITGLRQELAERNADLLISQERLKGVENKAVAEKRSLRDRIAQLEEDLTQALQGISWDEVQSLQTELQSHRTDLRFRDSQVVDMRNHLVAAETREQQYRGQMETEHGQLVVANNDLNAQNQQLLATCEALKTSYDQLVNKSHDLLVIQQDRDAAFGRVLILQDDLRRAQEIAQESESRAQATEASVHQAMSDIKTACDSTLAQKAAETAEAQQKAALLSEEYEALNQQVGMALRDAERAHQKAKEADRTIEVLEHRLQRWEASHSAQEIPRRQPGNVGSISTALADSQLKVTQQLAEIMALRRQLDQYKQSSAESTDQVLRSNFEKLKQAMATEKRAHTEDNIRWDKRTRDLEAECQKLRISRSNAGARPGPLVRGTPPRNA
ncbi:hypothetical protein BDV25DRAFT_153027 [Aspergillus avenaceus]|uniref:Integral membrane protein n=1 Tax=Aspergillus avenaceus TaxID=36643 RepID=A0A5N6TXW8_ASPAV|nr:hypothetical protein BDV25DRAFT_153027 [Aspergillus avenaceus]